MLVAGAGRRRVSSFPKWACAGRRISLTVLYGKKTIPEHSNKSGKFPKMGVRRALRARGARPFFGIYWIFFEFSGWIFFPYNTVAMHVPRPSRLDVGLLNWRKLISNTPPPAKAKRGGGGRIANQFAPIDWPDVE